MSVLHIGLILTTSCRLRLTIADTLTFQYYQSDSRMLVAERISHYNVNNLMHYMFNTL